MLLCTFWTSRAQPINALTLPTSRSVFLLLTSARHDKFLNTLAITCKTDKAFRKFYGKWRKETQRKSVELLISWRTSEVISSLKRIMGSGSWEAPDSPLDPCYGPQLCSMLTSRFLWVQIKSQVSSCEEFSRLYRLSSGYAAPVLTKYWGPIEEERTSLSVAASSLQGFEAEWWAQTRTTVPLLWSESAEVSQGLYCLVRILLNCDQKEVRGGIWRSQRTR